ncbi:MAG: copper resistance system multicopper oxidase [Pseudomonadaceae bacterium]|nr:copper resistance system multicopper oxidase [Pseudomonadaceae bacterium]
MIRLRQKKIDRRRFLQKTAAFGGALALQATMPAWARSGTHTDLSGLKTLSGTQFDLHVAAARHTIDGEQGRAVLINGQLPAPLLRWREGDELTLNVTNHLKADTSIHWHGILLPFQMDGVPGVTFPGIKPGETFTYEFPLIQAGTYWYHSHSGLQEQLGHYGPIVIEPKSSDPVAYDREYVIVLSDWTFEDPHRVFAKLKKMSDNYNFQQRTVDDFFDDAAEEGFDKALSERLMWGAMRMNPTDIADVTGATYTYLLNGHSPLENWTGLFKPGERVRLRFINAAAMSIFNVRIPGLPMTVVQADGLNVRPVETDEFQIGVAETYDVIVQPEARQAYTLMAESNDRSGFARATLTPELGMVAPVPDLRPRPTLTMKDMAMDHSTMDHSQMTHDGMDHAAMGHDKSSMNKNGTHEHATGPGVVGLAMNPTNRLAERPNGLEDAPHRVLVYTGLKALDRNPDTRNPEREMELHLTSNMERYMWSFDGVKFSEVDGPIVFYKDERLRLTLVNDTMMPHPIHLHGMFFDVVTNEAAKATDPYKPRKHTIVVKPGEKLSVDITADAVGDWAFHCHLLYHMHAGMMRVVSIRDEVAPT